MSSQLDVMGRFETFINEFTDEKGILRYREKIREMPQSGSRSLYISFNDLLHHDPRLAEEVLVYPEECLFDGTKVLIKILQQIDPKYIDKYYQFHLRIDDLTDKVHLRTLRTEHLGLLTRFEGIVIGVTDTKPLLIEGHFKCASCGEPNQIVEFPEGIYSPPYQCENDTCQRKGSLVLQIESSRFIDWQKITIQEKPEELPPGQLPQSIMIHILDDLVDKARPGDRVEVVGVLKARASRMLKRGQLATYGKFFNGVSIRKEKAEYIDIDITDEDLANIKELSESPYIIEKIRDSLAPSIYGHDLVKEAIATLLFGGTLKVTPDGMKIRGESNILLIGDPGVGKSQLLKFVSRLAPRALYTTGKGSTAAGLTAAVIRDQDTGEITLEAGALVLADQGIAMIDEFDKMRSDDRTAIHEAMEQHSYHPSFEIMFSNGERTHIGSYVDDLFRKYEDSKRIGVDCEILQIENLKESIFSTDFSRQFHHPITHVSRHSAPDHFIQIKYSNGRTITVTPEHPVFTFQNEYIDEKPAEELITGDFIPAVRSVNYLLDDELSLDIEHGRKKVKLPRKMNASLSRFLGYFVSEGYSYEGFSIEVGLSNTDTVIISDMIKCIEDTFGIKPIDNTEKGRVLRIISKSVFEYLKQNFPEIMKLSIEKRIPRKIFSTSLDNKITFLNAAFLGDGAIESEALAFSTSSEKLAFDYQDLMLNIGIHSRIHSSNYLTRINREPRIRYKVYVRGDNLDTFVNLVIPTKINNGKLRKLLVRSQKVRGHDILPPSVGHIIKRCMKILGIPYNGYFQQAFQENCGITIEVINRYLDQIFTRKTELEQRIPTITDMKTFREITNLSQNHVAKLTGSSRGNIDYIERGGYVFAKRIEVLAQAKQEIVKELNEVEQSLSYIENLKKYRWLRISEIKTIPNRGKFQTNWVYDVTVDPIRIFISQGIILHNTISIAKAGIVATLNARTSILAAANPKRGRWNPFKATAENLNLPPTILSRFDLIFVLEDKPNLKEDHEKASHILRLHKLNTLPVDPPIEQELLRKYIAYARSEIKPKLSDEAVARLLEYYTELRSSSGKIEEGRPDPIAITPRQLEALVRLSEARAKMRLSEEVTYEDASGAVHLMNATLDKLARDETGKLDIDKYSSGLSDQGRRRLDRIDDLIDNMLKESDDGEPVAISTILARAVEDGLDRNQVEKAIEQRIRVGKLFSPQPGRVKKI